MSCSPNPATCRTAAAATVMLAAWLLAMPSMAAEPPEGVWDLIDLTTLILRLKLFLSDFWMLVEWIAWLTGAAAVVIGVNAAGRRADQGPGQGGWAGPIAWMLSGFALLSIPKLVDSLTATMIPGQWTHATSQIFSTAPNLMAAFDGAAAAETIVGILRIIQFIGFLAVFRGILLLNAAAQPAQRATVGAGMTHLAGGALAVNISAVLGILDGLISA